MEKLQRPLSTSLCRLPSLKSFSADRLGSLSASEVSFAPESMMKGVSKRHRGKRIRECMNGNKKGVCIGKARSDSSSKNLIIVLLEGTSHKSDALPPSATIKGGALGATAEQAETLVCL